MKLRSLLILIGLFSVNTIYGQDMDSVQARFDEIKAMVRIGEFKNIGIVAGIHQFDQTFLELGIARSRGTESGCAFGVSFSALSFSAEYNLDKKVGGLMLSAWRNGFILPISLGINVHSYTNFNQVNYGFRPMIGFGFMPFSLTYGYNFEVIKNDVKGINKHVVSLRYYFRMIELIK